MTPAEGPDSAAGIRHQLRQIALQKREDLNVVLERYGRERLLYRVGRSAHGKDFVLKGATLFVPWEDNLGLPFEATLLGVSATVERVELNDRDEIVAICRRGRDRQRVPLLDLPLPSTKPSGWEWIEAYRHWRRGG
jgi:hypothetical protein